MYFFKLRELLLLLYPADNLCKCHSTSVEENDFEFSAWLTLPVPPEGFGFSGAAATLGFSAPFFISVILFTGVIRK